MSGLWDPDRTPRPSGRQSVQPGLSPAFQAAPGSCNGGLLRSGRASTKKLPKHAAIARSSAGHAVSSSFLRFQPDLDQPADLTIHRRLHIGQRNQAASEKGGNCPSGQQGPRTWRRLVALVPVRAGFNSGLDTAQHRPPQTAAAGMVRGGSTHQTVCSACANLRLNPCIPPVVSRMYGSPGVAPALMGILPGSKPARNVEEQTRRLRMNHPATVMRIYRAIGGQVDSGALRPTTVSSAAMSYALRHPRLRQALPAVEGIPTTVRIAGGPRNQARQLSADGAPRWQRGRCFTHNGNSWANHFPD